MKSITFAQSFPVAFAIWVEFWHYECSVRVSEAIKVRRAVYLLLAIFVVQLSGLRAVCVPTHRETHACCPTGTGTTPPSSSSVPDCCVSSLLNYQGSITETRNINRPSECTAQSGAVSIPSAEPLVAIIAPALQQVLHPISPPLSPLSQSCLLLI
jgi:hypothetical protein